MISPYGYWIVHIRYWIRIYMQRICQMNVQLLWKPVSVIPLSELSSLLYIIKLFACFFGGEQQRNTCFGLGFETEMTRWFFRLSFNNIGPAWNWGQRLCQINIHMFSGCFPNEGWLHFWGLSFQSLMINSIFWRLTSPFLTLESLESQCLKIKSSWLWLPILEPQMLNCFGRWFLRFD